MDATTPVLTPGDAAEIGEIVRWAVSSGTGLDIRAGGSKRGLGRPVDAGAVLDLSRLAGVTLYEPGELVLTAAAATPLSDITALLAGHRQHLAFEPPDLGRLLGAPAGVQTLGGILACALSGPRRPQAGAARDHFLGFAAVGGQGLAFRAGGRVVKNVTGYDLPKLMAGSFGTLAVLTAVTVKVLPAPETTATLLIQGLDDGRANAALTAALASPCEVSAAAHLPAAVAAGSRLGRHRAATVLRLEGFPVSVAARRDRLAAVLAGHGPIEDLGQDDSLALWREIRDATPLCAWPDRLVWRLSVPPATGAAVASGLRAGLESAGMAVDVFYDWGGGLIWAAVTPDDPAAAEAVIRGAVAAGGGHAVLIRAPEALRRSLAVFEPLPGPVAALNRRVKDSFDPCGVFSPGRMYPRPS